MYLRYCSDDRNDSLSLVYKIENDLVPQHRRQMFESCEGIHTHITRSISSGNSYIKKMNMSKGKTMLAYSGAETWNNLPNSKDLAILLFTDIYRSYWWHFWRVMEIW